MSNVQTHRFKSTGLIHDAANNVSDVEHVTSNPEFLEGPCITFASGSTKPSRR